MVIGVHNHMYLESEFHNESKNESFKLAVIFNMYKKDLILIPERSNCDLKFLSKGHICIIELRSLKLAYLDSCGILIINIYNWVHL